MAKKVVVIGAGFGGMSAATYPTNVGADVTLLERVVATIIVRSEHKIGTRLIDDLVVRLERAHDYFSACTMPLTLVQQSYLPER